MEIEARLLCNICEKQFSIKSTLNRHLRQIHHIEPNPGSIVCPQCTAKFYNYTALRYHIAKTADHNTIIRPPQEIKFNSMAEFTEWKEKISKESKCQYMKRTGKAVLASQAMSMLFECHRTGFYQCASTGKRRLKNIGSKKINGNCPSVIEVRIFTEMVKVRYHPTHFYHDTNIKHMTLTSKEKSKLASKIVEGLSFEKILDEVRDGTEEADRMNLLTRKDLHNLKHRLICPSFKGQHENDLNSAQLWVESMASLGHDSPVLHYKEEGVAYESTLFENDMHLIIMTQFQQMMLKQSGLHKLCIDSTHRVKSYDFHITTLLIIDDLGYGCPVSYFISNKINKETLEVFFLHIRKLVGKIKAAVIMSVDSPAFHSAWISVMGSTENWLLSSWHVERNWRKKLAKVPGSQSEKIAIHKMLKVLLHEPEKDKFSVTLQKFLTMLSLGEETCEFMQYFLKDYVDKVHMWAFCYQAHLGISTNMHLEIEAMHEVVKQFYLDSQETRRLVKMLNALMDYTKDQVIHRVITNPLLQAEKINDSHNQAESISERDIITARNNVEWKIRAENKKETYKIERVDKPTCGQSPCDVSCLICNICIHMYKCTCLDNSIHCNICEHIHACIIKATFPSTHNNIDTEECNIDTRVSNPTGVTKSSFDNGMSQSEMAVKRKLNLLKHVISTQKFSSTTYSMAEKWLDRCLVLFKSHDDKHVQIPNTHKSPLAVKKMQPKRTIAKKRKSPVKESIVSKPLCNENKSIEIPLQLRNEELYIDTVTDHDYYYEIESVSA